MFLLGYDIGSSSVKVSVLSAETGKCLASAYSPKEEMEIVSDRPGWAEQDPMNWWKHLVLATQELLMHADIDKKHIVAIGLSYQMHGLVIIDKQGKPLRPSIIWCDSRAVGIGQEAFQSIGSEKCLSALLNSPGNFTASKLKWVKDHEPDIYEKVYKMMLPGDYIAYLLTGEIRTTPSGLSEGIMWDFQQHGLSETLMDTYGFNRAFIPEVVPNFSVQGTLTSEAASELGLDPGIPLTYRAGDQPNNAFSLNVLHPGEVAATAGTSGVVYGVSDQVRYDHLSRVNTFAHVNHSEAMTRLGVLLCINGTGILNSWLKRHVGSQQISYNDMNALAAGIKPGSEGLSVLPFGNGAERMIGNKNIGCVVDGLDFNRHTQATLLRASQEGIVFSFHYGMEIMKETGITPKVIRAGHANMFLSDLFAESLASVSGAAIELYNTDGSQGAARAAGIGCGIYKSPDEAFDGLQVVKTIKPNPTMAEPLNIAYQKWKTILEQKIRNMEPS